MDRKFIWRMVGIVLVSLSVAQNDSSLANPLWMVAGWICLEKGGWSVVWRLILGFAMALVQLATGSSYWLVTVGIVLLAEIVLLVLKFLVPRLAQKIAKKGDDDV